MRSILFFGMAWSLVSCAHGGGGGVDPILQDLPAEHLGAVLFTRDSAKFLEFCTAEAEAIDKIGGGDFRKAVQEGLGFNPLTKAGITAMGLDPERPMALWLGGENPKKTPLFHGVLPVADRAAFLKAVDQLLEKSSLARGTPVSTAKGEWIGFSRSTGQRSEPAGGLLLGKNHAVFTNGEREGLQAFSTGPSVAQHPHLDTLRKASQGGGQIALFFLPQWLQRLDDSSLAGLPQAAALYGEARLTPGQEMFFEALSFSLPDTLAQQRRLAPEPGMRIPSPSGAVLAGTGTFSASEWFAIAQKDEKVAKLLQGQEEKLKGLEPLLKMMGSDITFTLGVDGEPSNPMVLLGSLFVRLDIGGGQPRETMEGLVELARGLELPTDKLRPAEGGYDLFIPPVVLIRLRADDRSLSIAYGREAKPDPESALMKLAEGQLQAGLFDGAKVGRMVSAMVPMKFGPKIGALLQRYGSWETWSSTLNTITAGYGRIRITP